MSRAFIEQTRKVGLPQIRLHDLRHTHATHLHAAGVPVQVVQRRLGHSHPSITLGVYGHLLPGADKDAADAVAAMLG